MLLEDVFGAMDRYPQEVANIAWPYSAVASSDLRTSGWVLSEVVVEPADLDAQHLANAHQQWTAPVLHGSLVANAPSSQVSCVLLGHTMQELANAMRVRATPGGEHCCPAETAEPREDRTLKGELQRAISQSKGELYGDREAALLFEVNAGELAWAYCFVSQARRPLLAHVKAAILDMGRAFDRHHGFWEAHPGVRRPLAALSLAPGVERPSVPHHLPGMCLVLKPPGWEVDTEGDSGFRHLSGFIQAELPEDRRAVAFRPDFSFGFIHRLDAPSSGLILTATSFEGYSALEWQMYTYEIAREYHVVGHGVARVPQRDVVARILDVRTAIVAENGRPAQSHIRFLADIVRSGGAAGMFCIVSIKIFTGRRHQIRVHMQHCECAAVADSRYHPGPNAILGPGHCVMRPLYAASTSPAQHG